MTYGVCVCVDGVDCPTVEPVHERYPKDDITKSMLTQYADIDREDTKTFLDTELDATTHPRKVQDDTALYHCLYDSLNIDARNRINLKKNDFTLANNTESGVLLIKVITMAAQVATRSTATLLMSQLTAGMHQLYDECGTNRNCSIHLRSRIHLPQPGAP